nr:MAG TPA: phosphoadenosine-phosphosulfate reductase [Caudoviricetes sp.]
MNDDRYSDDNKIHDTQRLKELQALPLERKVLITQSRILEWYKYWNGQVYISFSGGKDSTVLLHIVRNLFPNVEAVFVDTGLEYPELRAFVKTFDNVTCLKPKMNFRQVIDTYGYPLISKEVANIIRYARKGSPTRWCKIYNFDAIKDKYTSRYNLSRYKRLADSDIPISEQCCDIMKKKPCKDYEKQSGKKAILGTMAYESGMRKKEWIRTGCNAFEALRPISKPISFWTENDVLEYIIKNNLQIASVYGKVVKTDEGYTTTGERRTGCMFCGFGCHLEKSPNRFERMKITHPQIWDYCIRPKDQGGLGMGDVLDFIHVPYGKEER